MKKCLLLQVLAMCIIYMSAEIKTYTEDYCWRDYEGIVPSDALQHGLDNNGHPVYIGQVLFEDKLIPGQIYEQNKKIYFEWKNKEYSTDQNAKILCSTHADNFEWVETRHNEVVLLTNKLLIRGGYEPNVSTYIGRVEKSGITNVGKVICTTDDCFGLYTTNDGVVQVHSQFQILTYNRV